jgi:hypothetical protein
VPLALVGVLVALVPAAGGQGLPPDGELRVTTTPVGGGHLASIFVSSSEPIARLVLDVPIGYEVDLAQPAGAEVGSLTAILTDTATTLSRTFLEARLVVDEKDTTDVAAQACAPGAHSAVWRADFSIGERQFSLPIVVDAPSPAARSGMRIVFCPAWSPPAAETSVAAQALSLVTQGVLAPPTAPGRYTSSALVAPAGPGSVDPDPTQVFELRSVLAQPHTLTLETRYEPRTKSVLLTGMATADGEPEAGLEVSFDASTDLFSEATSFGPVRTDAAGEFAVRRRIDRTTQFVASVETTWRACSSPSSAPAGCSAETFVPPRPTSAVVRIRGPRDPRLAARAPDQARSRRIAFRLSDFPAGWEAVEAISVFSCPGFDPELSDLTTTGVFESPSFATDDAVVSSRVAMYLTEAHARTAYGREAVLGAARCLADELRDLGYEVVSLGAVPVPPLGTQTRLFRVVASVQGNVVTLDQLAFRRGRTVVHLGFLSTGQQLPITHELAAKVAARSRSK